MLCNCLLQRTRGNAACLAGSAQFASVPASSAYVCSGYRCPGMCRISDPPVSSSALALDTPQGFESAAFKLSHEMTQLLDPGGSRTSPHWRLFEELVVRGYLAVRSSIICISVSNTCCSFLGCRAPGGERLWYAFQYAVTLRGYDIRPALSSC